MVEAGRMAAERGRHRPHCSLGLLCFQRLCPQPRRHGDLLFHPICPLQDKKVVVLVIRHALSPWINFWAGSRANIPCQRANRRVYNAVPTEESTGNPACMANMLSPHCKYSDTGVPLCNPRIGKVQWANGAGIFSIWRVDPRQNWRDAQLCSKLHSIRS